MSARELNQAKQHLYNSLLAFNQRWVLNGTDISCPECRHVQSVEQAGQPFVHQPACPNRGDFAQHPWDHLRNALERLPVLMAAPGGSTVDPAEHP